jgi:outer membrane protein assembly factor BamB
LLLLFSSIAAVRAQDYPQWRGLHRDGSASDFHEPKSWPEKLTKRWSVEVGEGYSTPILAGNRILLFTRQGDNEVLTALDAATGKIAWQSKYPAPYKVADPAKAHGPGPKSTPLLFRGKIYTIGISGIVSAFDAADGRLAWQKPVKGEAPFFGAASSPLGDGELIILHPGNYEPLTALDAATGTIKWQSKGEGEYVSPIIVELGGVRQVVTMTQEDVVGVSLTDGSVLWSYPWPSKSGGMHAITPLVYRDTIIVSSYHSGVSAIKPVFHDSKWSADGAWHTDEVSMFLSNPVLIGGVLFGLSERASGQYFGLDAKTGKVLWLGKPREATNTAVAKAGELLFLLNDDGELTVAQTRGGAMEPVANYHVADGATWAQPAISGSRIFVKDLKSLTLWTID